MAVDDDAALHYEKQQERSKPPAKEGDQKSSTFVDFEKRGEIVTFWAMTFVDERK